MSHNVRTESKTASLARASGLSPGAIATICGILSAVGYTATNICLKIVDDVDPVWVSCVKAMPTVIGTAPFVLRNIVRKKRAFPNSKVLQIVLLVALFSQFGGNVAFQWALNVIGLALDVPITLAMMIVSGAVFGRLFLGDAVTIRMAVAGTILIVATFVLSLGANSAKEIQANHDQTVNSRTEPFHRQSSRTSQHELPNIASEAESTTNGLTSVNYVKSLFVSERWGFLLGVLAACLAGISYCSLSTVVRYAAMNGADKLSLIGVICLVGVISLGGFALIVHGPSIVFAPTADQYKAMVLAGTFNYLAFLSLTMALEVATVYFVNALSTCQVLMSAIAGIMLFGEQATIELGIGIILISIGLLSMKPSERR